MSAATSTRDDCTVPRDYEPVRFVVVGLGMGAGRAKLITETPGARLLGVVDLNEERARKTGRELNVPHTLELQPWLENDQVDVVYVLTETGRHAAVACPALEAGKHVLLTKPMEASLAACDEMIRLAERHDRLLGVDFQMRFLPETLNIKAAMKHGTFGRLLAGQMSLRVLRTMEYFKQGAWRGTRRLDGGGVLSNQAIHHIDQLAFTVGIPARVRCELRTQAHDIEAEDLACALWEYADGCLLSVLATTSFPQDTWYTRLDLHGTAGAVTLAGGGDFDDPYQRWFVDGVWRQAPPVRAETHWLNAVDNFAAAVCTAAPLVCSGRDARRTQAVLEAMYSSGYTTRDWVPVEPELPPK